MSWSWHIYAPRTRAELEEVAAAYEEALGTHIERFEVDEDSEVGAVFVAGEVPSVEAVVATRAEYGDKVSEALVERLAECTAALEIDNPGIPEVDPLQASALHFLLEALGPAIIDWGDHDLEPGEEVMARLSQFPNVGRLGEGPDQQLGEGPAAKLPPGTQASMDLLEELERISLSQERRIDFERNVRALSEEAQYYLRLIYTQGAHSDKDAARKLDYDVEDIPALRTELNELLARS